MAARRRPGPSRRCPSPRSRTAPRPRRASLLGLGRSRAPPSSDRRGGRRDRPWPERRVGVALHLDQRDRARSHRGRRRGRPNPRCPSSPGWPARSRRRAHSRRTRRDWQSPSPSIQPMAACSAGHSSVDQGEVAGARGIGAGQHDEQRGRVDPAVVAAERHLAQPRHLALARLVHDLARRRVVEARGLGRLMGGQILQDAAGQRRVEPQHLQRGDDRVAAEGGREPGDAGIGVGAGRQLGRQQRQVGARLVEPLVEQPAGRCGRVAPRRRSERMRVRGPAPPPRESARAMGGPQRSARPR